MGTRPYTSDVQEGFRKRARQRQVQMSILKEIANASRWTETIYEGKLTIQGRILSPAEAESAGLSSALIASTLADPEDVKKIQEMAENNDNIDMLLSKEDRAFEIVPRLFGQTAGYSDIGNLTRDRPLSLGPDRNH